MDGTHFDALARSLSTAGSRRRALGGLLVSALGLLGSQTEKASAKKKKPCPPCKKRKKGKCKANLPDGTSCENGGSCLSGSCRPPAGPLDVTPPPSTCSPAICAGCCDAQGVCQPGNTHLACGSGGGPCAACANPKPVCFNNVCTTCQNNAPARPCPNGCCDGITGTCLPGTTRGSCGAVGGACQTCPWGVCANGVCTCDNTSCSGNMCCDPVAKRCQFLSSGSHLSCEGWCIPSSCGAGACGADCTNTEVCCSPLTCQVDSPGTRACHP